MNKEISVLMDKERLISGESECGTISSPSTFNGQAHEDSSVGKEFQRNPAEIAFKL